MLVRVCLNRSLAKFAAFNTRAESIRAGAGKTVTLCRAAVLHLHHLVLIHFERTANGETPTLGRLTIGITSHHSATQSVSQSVNHRQPDEL